MKRKTFLPGVISLLILFQTPLCSQRLPVHVFTAKDGLLSGDPLFVDRQGFLWFGSEEGLTAYDGTEFTFFGKAHGLLDNVNNAVEDLDGTIWIGGHNGITKARRSASFPLGLQFTPFVSANGKAVGEINVIAQTPDGAILFSGQGGVFEVREGMLKQCVVMERPLRPNPLSRQFEFSEKDHFNNVLFDHTGVLWLTTRHSLYRCENHGRSGVRDTLFLQEVIPIEEMFSDWTNAAFFDDHDRLWFSTGGTSLFVVERSLKVHRIDTPRLGITGVNGFMYDGGQKLWIGDGDRLHAATIVEGRRGGRTSLQVAHTITTGNGIPRGSLITKILKDNTGNLWANALWGGVLRVSMRGFAAIEAPSLGVSSIHRVVDGPGNRLWISSQERVFRVSMGSTQDIRRIGVGIRREAEQRLSKPVLEFTRIGADTLLVTDESGRISWMDCSLPQPTFRRFHMKLKDPKGSILYRPNVWIVKVFRDRSDDLWLSANLFGLFRCRIRGDTIVVLNMFTMRDGLPDHGIRAITQTRDGILWFGGFNGGLARFDGTSFRTLTTADGLADNYIRSLYETSDSTLWVGTRYNGLCAYKDGRFHLYPSFDALRSTSIWSIADDETGRLWLATGQGLKSFVPDPLFQSQPLIRGYDESDGIPKEAAFNLHTDQKKNLYVTTRNGVYIVPHRFMSTVPLQPTTYIRSVAVNGKEVIAPDALELSPSDQTLTISFGEVEFSQRGSALFQYMLEGLTSQWSVPTPLRNVTFAKLPPGDYLFKVRSLRNFRTVETQTEMARGLLLSEQSMRFTVATPFWRSWWFLGAVALVLVVVVATAFRFRMEQLLRVERLRGNIALDLHDDIGSSLTRIALFSDVFLREVGQLKRGRGLLPNRIKKIVSMAEEIGVTSRDLIDAMSDIVWSVDPKKDSFEELTLRMKTYAGRILEAKEIEYEIAIDPGLSSLQLPLEYRRNIFLLFKEGLNNIIRHSGATHVRLTLRLEGASLVLVLQDDGKGFAVSPANAGHGLGSMKQRGIACHGTVELCAVPERGTTITVRIPI